MKREILIRRQIYLIYLISINIDINIDIKYVKYTSKSVMEMTDKFDRLRLYTSLGTSRLNFFYTFFFLENCVISLRTAAYFLCRNALFPSFIVRHSRVFIRYC